MYIYRYRYGYGTGLGNCEDPPWVSEGIGFGGHVRKCGPK